MQITIREPGSALTHFIGMMMALAAATPLLIKAAASSTAHTVLAMSIFMLSMVLLYGASATYHSLNISGKALRIFRKLDHMMIFVLIAGSYTPVCLISLGGKTGYTLLTVVWGIACLAWCLRPAGSPAPNGFLPSFILQWAGCVLAYSALSGTCFPTLPFSGSLQEG